MRLNERTQVDLSQMRTFADIARFHARERPEALALSFAGRKTTFSRFDQRTNQVANALLREGVRQGDRISYLGKNSDIYFELLFGAAKVGAVMAPISWRLAVPEVSHVLKHAATRVLFLEGVFSSLAEAAIAASSPRIITLGGERADYEVWLDAAPISDPGIEINAHDVAMQLYTSGTTGLAKGAMISHDNVISIWRRNAEAGEAWSIWTPADVSLLAMPISHIGGTGWGIVALLNGASSVIVSEFSPESTLDAIEHQGVSKLFLVPSALRMVLQLPLAREVNYGRIKNILYGASPIAPDLLRECIEVFQCDFCQLFGMTETSGPVTCLPPEDHDLSGNQRMRGAGKATPGVELRILDEAGQQLPANTVGQIATRSSSNMKGYWRDPEATAATIDKDGWLMTGDGGFLDVDGYLYIKDRIKDVIISGGENIYPTEVENAIYGHPGIADVAVIGVPDEKWGEAVKAIVVSKPEAHLSSEDVITFARTRIAAFKAPKSVDFVNALPRNAAGKVLRRLLREPYWASRERNVN